jgi:CheY-like chemotaxis protein
MSGKPKILCVDDKVDNLRIRAMLLEQFGCETIIAPDHTSALRAFTESSIDLVLLDYHLARGETGEELARDLRVMCPKLPIIMLTGDVQLPLSAAQNVDAVLIKGMSSPQALLDLIDKLLPGAGLTARPPMCVRKLEKVEKQWDGRKRGKAS